MNFLEKDLEDIIYENANTESGKDFLANRGLELRGHTFRQVNLGEYGIADLINISTDGCKAKNSRILIINIIELKNGVIDGKTLAQAMRYYKAIYDLKAYAETYAKNNKTSWFNICIHITLIGKSVTDEIRWILPIIFGYVDVYTYSYKINGLQFEYTQPPCAKIANMPNNLVNRILNPSVEDLKSILEV